jgi:predicted MPP superfamily phosphohydrolase
MMRMMVFFITMISLWAGAHYYMGARLVSASVLPTAWTRVGWGILVLLMFMAPATFRIHGAEGWNPWCVFGEWVGYTLMAVSSIAFGLTVLRDAGWLLALAVDWLVSLKAGNFMPAPGALRQTVFAWSSLGVVAATFCMVAAGTWVTRRGPLVEEYDVRIKDLPAGLEGFRIVQFTDLHMARTTSAAFARQVTESVNAGRPDVVVFTGDFGEGKVATQRERIAALAEIRAPHGKFFVTGNHEYYSDFPRWIDAARKLGFTVLMNESRVMDTGRGRVLIAGVTDHRAGEINEGHATNVSLAARGIEAVPAPRILLAHQPRATEGAAEAGFDLMVCGHTHGGQYFPYTYVVKLFFCRSRGLGKVGNMNLFVSRGTGYWGPPVRFGSSPEISFLVLRGG